MTATIKRQGFFSGRICQYVSLNDISNGRDRICHDLLYIRNTKDYDLLFSFLKQYKDREIIFECDKSVNVEKLLNDSPKREDCFPVIDYLYYKINQEDSFSVSDISNLRIDDIVYYELRNESDYDLWKRLSEQYTNCSFELDISSLNKNNVNVLNKLMNERFSIVSRTRIIL